MNNAVNVNAGAAVVNIMGHKFSLARRRALPLRWHKFAMARRRGLSLALPLQTIIHSDNLAGSFGVFHCKI
jgi:hypothetical protein